jgi:hypothetical protein
MGLSARGLTTGPLHHAGGAFEVNVDLLADEVNVVTSAGRCERFPLTSMSVARFVELTLELLSADGHKRAHQPYATGSDGQDSV